MGQQVRQHLVADRLDRFRVSTPFHPEFHLGGRPTVLVNTSSAVVLRDIMYHHSNVVVLQALPFQHTSAEDQQDPVITPPVHAHTRVGAYTFLNNRAEVVQVEVCLAVVLSHPSWRLQLGLKLPHRRCAPPSVQVGASALLQQHRARQLLFRITMQNRPRTIQLPDRKLLLSWTAPCQL